MIRLAARLAAGGGRSAVVGLLLTAVGVALGVTLLLTATAAWPALHQHDVRRGWLATSPENAQPSHDEGATDPFLWRLATTRFDGRDLVRVDVAALGPDAPVPPGLDALPSAGEVAASPALVDLFAERPPEELRDRFPGEVTSTVGREALASPEDLVVVVGHEPAGLRGAPDVVTVRSIETAPRSLLLTRAMRLALAIGAVGLIAPILVFVATATRLQAASRERRLAAMRLAGATRRQIGVVAGVEAAIAAFLGVALGFGCFLALRPTLARVPLDGASFYPSDLALSWGWSLAVALGVPALSVAAAVASVRRLGVTPLGIARRATRQRPSPRPLLLVAAGCWRSSSSRRPCRMPATWPSPWRWVAPWP